MEQPRPKYNDYPLEQCADAAEKLAAKGLFVYQKFTCDKCGSRQTMGKPNQFFTSGTCEECGYETDIARKGCNYMVTTILFEETEPTPSVGEPQ